MAKAKKKEVSGPVPTLNKYVEAFCDAPLTRKAVIDLSSMLAKVVGGLLQEELPNVEVVTGHRMFGGGISQHHLDAFVSDEHMGLKLGVDVKGLNSAASVGKNWNNRIGDFANMATNHHQHGPKAVMGGVLTIPYEGITKGTLANIDKTLLQMRGRVSWNNSHGQFEALALIVISKADRCVVADLPAADSPLRIETFASSMAEIYNQRFKK